MSKKASCISAFVRAGLVVVLIFASLAPAASQAKEIKLRYSLLWPASHPITKLAQDWGKDVEAATAGRVKVTTFPGNTLAPPMQAYDAVVKGIADMAGNLLAYAPGRLPLSEVLQQPLGYLNGYQSSKLANAYYKKFQPKEFDDVKVMYLHGAAPGFIFTKKAVNSIKDVKGLRIKANAENADIVINLGAAPVTMPVSDAYDSVQRGVIDGTLFPLEALQGYKIGEVVKTVIQDYGISYMTSMYVIMNKDKWNSMLPEDQKAIERINEEYNEKQAKLWVELDNQAKAYAMQKGVKFLDVSKEDQAVTVALMKPILDKYVAQMKAKGLPGEEALKFCLDYIRDNP
ncbi:MAG: TRAP transporter substrate-binding protein [Spirochaetia bacterium]|jgi:TRAP-type C4-dicarboxylate transport system substrate-binding protein|nr:TRAP transporter substrate-binding protein [Spirochaetia bacterium]